MLLLIYVAIMAMKLARIEKGLGEVAEIAEARRGEGATARRGRAPAAEHHPHRHPGPRRLWRDRAGDPALSELLALGVSHKTAPLELRERLSLTEGRSVAALRELTEAGTIGEAAAISTCNRTELYLVVSDPVQAESEALGVLTRKADIPPTELLGHLYSLRGEDASRHLLRVTAGLDSMIVGEAEIQGQVKRAYELALVEGATGPILNRLFRGALAAGGRARNETAIGERGVSIPSVAVEVAQRALGDLSERTVLMIGAGATAELVARALVARGVDTVFVANRHHDRALGLAERFDGEAIRFENLPEQLVEVDVVVSTTNSPHHIIERDGLEQVMAEREARPLVADRHRRAARHRARLPRGRRRSASTTSTTSSRSSNGTPACAKPRRRGPNGSSRTSSTASSAGSPRSRWCRRSRRCASAATRSCAGCWPRTRTAGRASTEADRARMELMANAIASRILHEPTRRIRRAAGSDDAYQYVSAMRELFGLDVETEVEAEADATAQGDRAASPHSGLSWPCASPLAAASLR